MYKEKNIYIFIQIKKYNILRVTVKIMDFLNPIMKSLKLIFKSNFCNITTMYLIIIYKLRVINRLLINFL